MTYVFTTALVLPKTKGALYVSTSRLRISAFMDAVPMKPGQLLIDLGCGDGRVLRNIRKKYKARCRGYELNILAYLKAWLLCMGDKEVKIRRQNFYNADLSGADVVFCYLFPDVMEKLSVKLKSELKPGTVIVSCNFPLPGYPPEKILKPQGSLHNDPIFIYHQPETKKESRYP